MVLMSSPPLTLKRRGVSAHMGIDEDFNLLSAEDAGQDSLLALEDELQILSIKESQKRHSLLAWRKVADGDKADQEVTRLQAQILLERAKGNEVSKMLESTTNTLRYVAVNRLDPDQWIIFALIG